MLPFWLLLLLLFISAESIDRSSGRKKKKEIYRRKETSGTRKRKKTERLDEDRWQKEPLSCSFSSHFLTSVRSTPYYTNTIPNNQFLYYRLQISERTKKAAQRINYKVLTR